jgi:hypothetical protein
MVARFNDRTSDIRKTHHFLYGEDLAETLQRYVFLNIDQQPQPPLAVSLLIRRWV